MFASPDLCPSTEAIKNEGLSDISLRDTTGHWFFGKTNVTYNTNVAWTFGILGVVAPNLISAKNKASSVLNSLNNPKGPFQISSDDYMCTYENNMNLLTLAFTPPLPFGFKHE